MSPEACHRTKSNTLHTLSVIEMRTYLIALSLSNYGYLLSKATATAGVSVI
jgi:hypothetical protein